MNLNYNEKGVGHVCSNCGQTVKCEVNTDMYEALKQTVDKLDSMLFPDTREAIEQALAKAERK